MYIVSKVLNESIKRNIAMIAMAGLRIGIVILAIICLGEAPSIAADS